MNTTTKTAYHATLMISPRTPRTSPTNTSASLPHHSHTSFRNLRNTTNIIDMITKRDKQIKEQLTATRMHLHLHGTASFESVAASDD